MQYGKTVFLNTISIHIGIIYEKINHMEEEQAVFEQIALSHFKTSNNFSIVMTNINNNIRIS